MAILFFGDSLTLGTGDPQQRGWPGRVMPRLARMGHAHDWYNLGIRGNTSPAMAARLEREARARMTGDGTDRMIFCFGAADCARQVPRPETEQAARDIFAASAAMAPTVFITPPPVLADWGSELAQRLLVTISAARAAGITVIDLFSALKKSDTYPLSLKSGDGVHPGAQGYDEIAETLLAGVDLPGLLGLK